MIGGLEMVRSKSGGAGASARLLDDVSESGGWKDF